jgi:hypothetical protein
MTDNEFQFVRDRIPPSWTLDEEDATLRDEQDAIVVQWPEDKTVFRGLVADAVGLPSSPEAAASGGGFDAYNM